MPFSMSTLSHGTASLAALIALAACDADLLVMPI